MTVRVTHAKVSGKAQGTDTTRVYGNHWDADHTVTGAAALDGGNVFTGGQTISPVSAVAPAITVYTPTSSLGQGLNINQTGAGTAPVSAPFVLGNYAFNGITINDAVDASSVGGVVGGLILQSNIAGASAQGYHGGGIFIANVNGAVPTDGTFAGAQGLSSLTQTLYPMGGTGTGVSTAKGTIYGYSSIVIAYGPGGSWPGATNLFNVTGGEINFKIATGASAYALTGMQVAALPDHAVQGAAFDIGYSLSAQNGAVGLRHGFAACNLNGQQPIATTGTVFGTIGAATVANLFDGSSYTVTGSAFKSTGFNVDGAGTITSGVWAGTNIGTTHGGTGLSSGTSGGVPYFDSTTTMATSGQLGGSALVVGGGPGGPPATIGSTGTTTTVLHGNAAGPPTWGPVALATDISGFGTGVATALGLNVGSAGAPITFNGALGTPLSGVATNLTGLPISTGLAGAGTGVLAALAINVGSAGAPVTFNGAGGTPSSIVLTNASGTAASLTAGSATTATTATNATNSAITNDTTTNATMNLAWVTSNTGNLPLKVTSTKLNFNPSNGNLAATLFNGNALTAGSYTLTGTAAKTLTFNNSLTLAGTDATTLTFQGTDTYVGRATTDTLTNKTFNSTGTGNVLQVSSVTVSAGQYPGEPTTGSATAGNVGEFVTSSVVFGSAVSLTTATPANVTSISLTAGDWDVFGTVHYIGGGTTNITQADASISNVSATVNTAPDRFQRFSVPAGYLPGGVYSLSAPTARISLSGTTTIYLVASSIFTVSTNAAYGYIGARRRR